MEDRWAKIESDGGFYYTYCDQSPSIFITSHHTLWGAKRWVKRYLARQFDVPNNSIVYDSREDK
jgi:hypothetical protein